MSKDRLSYPASRIDTVKDTYFGSIIEDEFRWLEGDENGHATEEVQAWTRQQNAFTRTILDKLPGRESLKARLKPLLEKSGCSLPVFAGNKLFYFRREGRMNQPCHYMRNEVDGPEKVILDPNALDESGLTAIAWIAPSHDGELLAYGIYTSGDENYQLRVMRTADLSHLDDVIDNKVGGVYWLPDHSGFVYSKLADVSNPYSREIRLHLLGEATHKDRLIFAQYMKGPLATTWGPFASLSDDGNWLILGYHTSTRSNDLWLVNFPFWVQTGELNPHIMVNGCDSTSHARIINNKVFIYSNDQAPNGQIFIADTTSPARENWQLFVAERHDAVLEDWEATSDSLILGYQKNACSELVRFNLTTLESENLRLPGIGTAGVSCSEKRSDIFVRFESYNYVPCILHHDLEKISHRFWWKSDINVDLSRMCVTQHWFASKDGTRVSMFLVHRDDMKKNGAIPTMIYGYGGFAISMTPAFNGQIVPWVEDGGVYAVVNLRGGNEYGDNWHKMGTRANKTKVFEDLEGAAEYLIAQNYTCPAHLAVSGRSNGGLLTGAALTRRPDLYKAVICGVPLLDMLRYQNFLMARYWVPEYGSSEVAEEFDWLIEYSPYHNICKDTRYPAVYLYTGENDTRVHPMHARKMAAALQTYAANGSDQPILLWVDLDSGHGDGKPLKLILEEQTDQWLFARWQTGLEQR